MLYIFVWLDKSHRLRNYSFYYDDSKKKTLSKFRSIIINHTANLRNESEKEIN